MVDRLDAALRRHEQLRPAPGRPASESEGRGLWDWLERDVTPVVGELLDRPDFRGHARWAVAHLAAGCAGPGRDLVGAIDGGLTGAAGALGELLGRPGVRAAVAGRAGAGGGEDRDLARVGAIARRPWRDLVSAWDYFGPAAGLNLVDPAGPPWGEFLPAFNPALRPPGDVVTRTLFLRVEHWRGALQAVWVRCSAARGIPPAVGDAAWDAPREALGRVDRATEALRSLWLGDPCFKVREACVTLVQAHAAVRRAATYPWLGEADGARGNAAAYADRVRRRGDVGLTDQVAAALSEVAGLYRAGYDPEEEIRLACAAHPLVLVEGVGRREVHWEGRRLEVGWHRHTRPWEFLAALARRHALGLGADGVDHDGEKGGPAKDARYRLNGLVPPGLMDRVVPAGRGTHRLNLPAGSVRYLRVEAEDRLDDVEPPPRRGPGRPRRDR